jgi:hypothetical protein
MQFMLETFDKHLLVLEAGVTEYNNKGHIDEQLSRPDCRNLRLEML